MLIGRTHAVHGGVDVLVNSAGVAFVGPTLDFDTADRDRAMAVNLRAPLAVIDTNCTIWQSGLFAELRCSAASAEIEVIGASMKAHCRLTP